MSKNRIKKTGKIDISDLEDLPEDHEFNTARYFADLGKDVKFIQRSNIPNVHTPDIRMDGVNWEMKAPVGKSRHTLEKILRKAMSQSDSIIFDLRRCKLEDAWAANYLTNAFRDNKGIRRLLIIRKNGSLTELRK